LFSLKTNSIKALVARAVDEITLKTNWAREDEDETMALEPLVNAVAGALFGLSILPI